ncbi:MAG: hypothetical protein J7L15_08910 [Clostridiales bacterium]|nr:hypothetical protein [Clostridiales bacterium]
MGLDMYLDREKYFFSTDKDKPFIKGFEDLECKNTVFSGIYWRKSNQIHHWFVENIQGGEDDCGRYYVELEQLKKLLEIIEESLAKKDNPEEVLPIMSGFFFGETDYDEYYWKDIERTKNELIALLNHPKVAEFDYYYRSSW